MKKNVDEKSFDDQIEEFAAPILKWQRKKPAKRSAMLLFCDYGAEEYAVKLMGNKRDKFPIATCLNGLGDALIAQPELLGWVKAHVRYAELELKRKDKQTKNKENGKSNS